MTELSNKMTDITKGGYRSGMVRHIAQGQNKLVKQAIRLDIAGVMEDFSTDMLTELYKHVKSLRRTEPTLPPEAPACPRIDEQPVKGDTGKVGMCGRCYDEGINVFPANCAEKPEKLAGQPLGQYHCPDCGAMVLAGLLHPDLCQKCLDRNHPGFDKPTGGGYCPRIDEQEVDHE